MKKIIVVFAIMMIIPAIAMAIEVNGHVDLYNRPIVENQDGSYSTIASIGIAIDHYELLITPITEEGKFLSEEELDQYINNFVIVNDLVTIESDPMHLVINITNVDGMSQKELEEVYNLGYVLHLEQELYYGL